MSVDIMFPTRLAVVQDYADLIQTHRKSNADITIATHAVGLGQARFRGCCKVEADSGQTWLIAWRSFTVSQTTQSILTKHFCKAMLAHQVAVALLARIALDIP